MNHNQKVVNYYDATHIDYRALWTGSYDRAVHFGYYDNKTKNHSKALIRMNHELAESVKIKATDIILDSGCGYGGSAMWLAENYGCKVTGVTISPLQVRKAQKYIEERNLGNRVTVLEKDFMNTHLTDNSFTVYWALESLVHAEDRPGVLKEAYRLLQPNGRIVISEYLFRESPTLSQSETAYMEPWLLGWAMPKLLTKSEFITELMQAGFKKIIFKYIILTLLEILLFRRYNIVLP